MEQSPSWEATTFSASQEIPHILWYPNVHYRIHKSSPHVPLLSKINQVYDSPLQFLNMHFNIIPHLRLGLPSGIFPSNLATKTLYAPHLFPIRATCPAHLIFLYLITRIIFDV